MYDAFVSYANEDSAWAEILVRNLYGAEKKPYYAPADIRTGQLIDKEIYDALKMQSRAGILVASNNIFRSAWVSYEYQIFLHLNRANQKFPILVLKIDDLKDSFPFFELPLHIDFRPSVSYRTAFARLLSGLEMRPPGLDPGYDGQLVLPPGYEQTSATVPIGGGAAASLVFSAPTNMRLKFGKTEADCCRSEFIRIKTLLRSYWVSVRPLPLLRSGQRPHHTDFMRVDRKDAERLVDAVSRNTGVTFRAPTEEEWIQALVTHQSSAITLRPPPTGGLPPRRDDYIANEFGICVPCRGADEWVADQSGAISVVASLRSSAEGSKPKFYRDVVRTADPQPALRLVCDTPPASPESGAFA